jgi:hypothetical protein
MKVDHTNPEELAAAAAMVLRTHPIVVIATVGMDGKPWAVPVHQVTDAKGRLTWQSEKNSRHSRNIAANPSLSATLFSATHEDGEISLFLEGDAAEVGDEPEITEILRIRNGSGKTPPSPTEFTGDANYRMYRFTPTAVWLNDDSHTKVQVDLTLFSQQIFLKEK